MSYTKLEVHYTTPSFEFVNIAKKSLNDFKKSMKVNTLTEIKPDKVKTFTLPKKVTDYGDKHGYSSIEIKHYKDHVILRGGGDVLMDKNIKGTNNDEWISSIVSTKWI